MKRVCIESPYAAATETDLERNIMYAQKCMYDSICRGEAPFLSHLLYTQVLDDTVAEDRVKGMEAHHSWLDVCDLVVVYTDLGISKGVWDAVEYAGKQNKLVLYRTVIKIECVHDWNEEHPLIDRCRKCGEERA